MNDLEIAKNLYSSAIRDILSVYSEDVINDVVAGGGYSKKALTNILGSLPHHSVEEHIFLADLAGYILDVSLRPREYFTDDDVEVLADESPYLGDEIEVYLDGMNVAQCVMVPQLPWVVGSRIARGEIIGTLISVKYSGDRDKARLKIKQDSGNIVKLDLGFEDSVGLVYDEI